MPQRREVQLNKSALSANQPGRQKVTRFTSTVALTLLVLPSAAVAKTPRNPDRLDKVVDCKTALRELVTAAQGSPLRSEAKNQDYLAKVAQLADSLCTDTNPPPRPAR
jgi:hypothetical protein